MNSQLLVSAAIQAEIQQVLSDIETAESVRILLAVESGSRAWGFLSKDSDYDVRFIYARKPWDYIRVFPHRDVIERPITDDLDISGWDLKKAFGLMRRSNPALMEWMRSPVIYQEYQPCANTFRGFATEAFSPLAACHHYRAMASGHQMRTGKKSHVRLKHYLYTLRPCLSALWVINHGTQPPMLFAEAVDAFVPAGELRDVVDRLVAMKSRSQEKDLVARLPVLDNFIEESLVRIQNSLPEAHNKMTKRDCNELFQTLLKDCWADESPEESPEESPDENLLGS